MADILVVDNYAYVSDWWCKCITKFRLIYD